ncbi:MAG: DUF2760 domain-containing protein [Candidatus Competibacterales bacterium]|nr:DUF2760 domain-containing protein [Candidatus Competibacterales bacterium]
MSETPPSFLARLALAWRSLTDSAFAARAATLDSAPAEPPPRPELQQAAPDSALQLLGLLQQEGRLVDFLREDVSSYSDADIGGAARVVHGGCRKVLERYLELEPISEREEGERLTLERGFDASAWRLTGRVVGEPPFTGTLTHRGWRARNISLPKVTPGHDVSVLAPAEVEL